MDAIGRLIMVNGEKAGEERVAPARNMLMKNIEQ